MKCDDTNDLWRRKDETPHQFWHNAGEAEERCCEKADTYNLFPSCEAPYKITNQNMCNFLALFYFNSGDINQPQNLYEVLELQLQNNDFLKSYKKKMLHQVSCLLIQQSLKCKTQPVISRQETNELMLIFCLDIWPNYCIVQLYHKVLIESDSIRN